MAIMRNSRIPDAWLNEAMRTNPFRRIVDKATGQSLGSLTTCPCRLSYPSIFEPEVNRLSPGQKGKYKATLLFPPNADLTLLQQEYQAAVQRLFPGVPRNSDGSFSGLWSPFKDQGAKSATDGYNPGAWAITVSTAFKPHVVDPSLNIVTDESRIYPGVWAIVAVNCYKYGVNPPQPKKGVGFGMQTVMIIADDERLGGGGGLDPNKAFAGIQVQSNFSAAEAFSTMPAAGAGGFAIPQGGRPTGGQQFRPVTEDDDVDSLR